MERKGPGQEKLYEKGAIDPIPEWVHRIVVRYKRFYPPILLAALFICMTR